MATYTLQCLTSTQLQRGYFIQPQAKRQNVIIWQGIHFILPYGTERH